MTYECGDEPDTRYEDEASIKRCFGRQLCLCEPCAQFTLRLRAVVSSRLRSESGALFEPGDQAARHGWETMITEEQQQQPGFEIRNVVVLAVFFVHTRYRVRIGPY